MPSKPWSGPDLHSNILVPQLRTRGDEMPHQLNTPRVLPHFQLHALRAHVLFRAFERDIFTDDDARDLVEQSSAAAHRTRRQSRIKRATAVGGCLLPACVFEAIHLGVMNDAAVLDTLIVAAPKDLAIAHEHRTDGYAARRQSFSRLLDRRFEKRIHAKIQAAARPRFLRITGLL